MRKMTSLFSAIVNTSSNLQGKKEGKVKIPLFTQTNNSRENCTCFPVATQEQVDNKTVQCTIQVSYKYRLGYISIIIIFLL